MISATIAFVVGLLLGIAVDARARKERDNRIKELEEQNNKAIYRVDDGAIEHALRSFDEMAE